MSECACACLWVNQCTYTQTHARTSVFCSAEYQACLLCFHKTSSLKQPLQSQNWDALCVYTHLWQSFGRCLSCFQTVADDGGVSVCSYAGFWWHCVLCLQLFADTEFVNYMELLDKVIRMWVQTCVSLWHYTFLVWLNWSSVHNHACILSHVHTTRCTHTHTHACTHTHARTHTHTHTHISIHIYTWSLLVYRVILFVCTELSTGVCMLSVFELKSG